ncbi:hypothetical protein D3C87_1129380 [compost metagenome]
MDPLVYLDGHDQVLGPGQQHIHGMPRELNPVVEVEFRIQCGFVSDLRQRHPHVVTLRYPEQSRLYFADLVDLVIIALGRH